MATKSQLISMIQENNLTIEEYSLFTKKYFQKEYRDFVGFVIQELDVDYESMILDIGCGPGWVSLELARRLPDAKIIGIDFESNLIQIAQRNRKTE